MSILICAMPLLCPVWCMAGLLARCGEHDAGVAAAKASACGGNGHRPHHEHDPGGDPHSHREHTCLCTGGTPRGAAPQTPVLEPAAIIAADHASVAKRDATLLLVLHSARGPTDTSPGRRCAPLLI